MVKNNFEHCNQAKCCWEKSYHEECTTTKNVLAGHKTDWKSCKQLPTLHIQLAHTTVGCAKSTSENSFIQSVNDLFFGICDDKSYVLD